MTSTVLGSTVIILLASVAAFFAVRRILAMLESRLARRLLFVSLVALSLTTIWFVDVNVPLDSSHLRPGGELIPGWVAALAWVAKVSMLFAVGVRRDAKPSDA